MKVVVFRLLLEGIGTQARGVTKYHPWQSFLEHFRHMTYTEDFTRSSSLYIYNLLESFMGPKFLLIVVPR